MNNLTQEMLKAALHYDENTGLFTWRSDRGNGSRKHDIAGRVCSRGHVQIYLHGKRHYAHRLVWLYVYGSWPVYQIDHIDGVRTNNNLANLRDVTHGINVQNRRSASKRSKSGLLGVSPKQNKWVAQISIDKKKKHIGYFDTAIEAHEAYMLVKREMHIGNTI